MKRTLLAAAILAIASTSASASITVLNSPFITSPTNVNTFTGLTDDFPVNTVYSEGGINVEYVGTNDYGIGNTGTATPWYINGGGYGYTSITLASNADFQNIQFNVSHGFSGSQGTVAYRLLDDGNVVLTGTTLANAGFSEGATWLGFSGSGFDEVDIQVSPFINGFDPIQYEAGAIGNISVAAVPEPETYAMMMAGLGLLGVMARRRKQKAVA